MREGNARAKRLAACGKYLLLCGAAVWGVSLALSAICFPKSRTLPDVRNAALEYVNSNNILSSETISEGYTPFYPRYSSDRVSAFILNDGAIKPTAEFAAKKYLIISNSFKNRYMAERSRYAYQCSVYDAIESNYDVVYRIDGESGNYNSDLRKGLIPNIGNALRYLFKEKSIAGDCITIYDLAPKTKTVRLKNCGTGEYLYSMNGAQVQSTRSMYDWVLYENDDGTVTMVSAALNWAIGLDNSSELPALCLSKGADDADKQWTVLKKDNANAYLISGNLALTGTADTVCLSEYTGEANQLWLIEG